MMIEIILFIVARVVEALRDAIDFNAGADPMPPLWHALKVPQYLLLALSGYYYISARRKFWEKAFVLLIGLASGFIVFELLLKAFRSIGLF